MGFQILNKNKEAMTINSIDAEVAAFWKAEVDPKSYACPVPDETNKKHANRFMCSNWYDKICWYIDYLKINDDWNLVRTAFLSAYINMDYPEWNDKTYPEKINDLYNDSFLKPYLDLIDYWQKKKYTPKYVQD